MDRVTRCSLANDGQIYFFWSIIFSYVDVLGDFNQQAVVIFLIVMYLTDTVFVFTPNGDLISLPKGAMPLDFAFFEL